MQLQTDEQTIDDLRIFSKRDAPGIYDIYNQTHTRGGEATLQEMFRHPLGNRELINQRSAIIEQYAKVKIAFPYNASLFDMAEKYLMNANDAENRSPNTPVFGEKEISNGVTAVIDLIRITQQFLLSKEVSVVTAYAEEKARDPRRTG